MKKSDSFSLCAHSRRLVNQPHAFFPTTLQRRIEIVDLKADVMDPGPSPRDEFRNWRILALRFQKLHESAACIDSGDSRAVGFVETFLFQPEDFPVERKRPGDR